MSSWVMPLKRLSMALVLAGGPACADTLTLRQAAQAALDQNPDLAASLAQVEQAQAGLERAEAARLPQVTLSLTATRTNDALGAFGLKLGQERIGAADFAPATLNDPAAINNLNTRIELMAPVYSGGQIGARLDEARALARAAQAGDAAARQRLLLEVLKAYQGVHLARSHIRLAEQASQAAAEYARVSEGLLRQGMAVKSDLLSARVNLENARVTHSEARRREATALDRLKQLMGRRLKDDLDVADEVLPALPPGGEEELRAGALARHPALMALRDRLGAAGSALAAARGATRPQLNLMARHDWNDDAVGLDAAAHTVAGVLTWSAFDGGVRQAAIDAARAARREQAARLRQMEDAIAFQVTEARRRALEAQERLGARAGAVAGAEEAQRLTRIRYANGVTTLVDLLAGQARLDRARADLAQARYDLAAGRGEVLEAVGLIALEQF